METIELQDNEAMLIVNEEGGLRFAVPNVDDDDDMPEYAVFIIAMAILLKKDMGLYEYVMDRFHEEILPPEKIEELLNEKEKE